MPKLRITPMVEPTAAPMTECVSEGEDGAWDGMFELDGAENVGTDTDALIVIKDDDEVEVNDGDTVEMAAEIERDDGK